MLFVRKADVIAYFGTVQQTADALEITRAAVYSWGPIVPERIAHRSAILSRGQLPFDPSLYPPKSKNVGGSEPRASAG